MRRTDRTAYRGELTEQDIPKALEYLEKASAQKNPYAAYLAGKIRLTEDAHKDIAKAIRHFEIAAEGGNDYAEYQLGKLYLYGKDIPQDYDKAIEYLTASAEHGNKYSVEFKLCAILDKLENGLNYFETVRKHWNLSTTAEANKYACAN